VLYSTAEQRRHYSLLLILISNCNFFSVSEYVRFLGGGGDFSLVIIIDWGTNQFRIISNNYAVLKTVIICYHNFVYKWKGPPNEGHRWKGPKRNNFCTNVVITDNLCYHSVCGRQDGIKLNSSTIVVFFSIAIARMYRPSCKFGFYLLTYTYIYLA